MSEPIITVGIVSWLLEERLIKTLIGIPKSTSLPLNLCLHVQGEEKVTASMKQRIIEASSGFVEKDIYFSSNNGGIASPRAANLKRAAKTPFVFMSDNDMDYSYGTIDAELDFLLNHPEHGMVDVLFNELCYYRTVEGTKVICTPIESIIAPYVDVDLIGGTSQLIRQEVALIPNIIDIRYFMGSWDFDFSMNVRKAGWKVATLTDRKLIAVNDKTQRTTEYITHKVRNPIIEKGRRLFESKWGFSCMWFPRNKIEVKPIKPSEISIISRAIYNKVGPAHEVGIIDEKHLEMMQRNFINCLKNQTDKNFIIQLAVGSEDSEATQRIKDLDWGDLNINFLYTSGDISQWEDSIKSSNNWAKETDKGSPEYTIKYLDYPRTSIMARMDIDDWVTPGWVAHMRYMADTIKEDRFLINYQVFGQAPDGQVYTFHAPHVRNRTSPFIAIVQKDAITVDLYETVHLRMGSLFDTVYSIPPSYVFMVVHGGNRSNQVYAADTFNYTRECRTEDLSNISGMRIPKESSIIVDNFSPRVLKNSWKDKIKKVQQTV